MFEYQLLEDHKGLLLIGDQTAWDLLRKVVHEIESQSPILTDDTSEIFLSLAYEARKAVERQRLVIPPLEDIPDAGVRFGVEMIWPYLLVQQRVLRQSLAYMSHSKQYQAVAYALEANIEDALKEDFGMDTQTLIDRWQNPSFEAVEALAKVDELTGKYLEWNPNQRKEHLAHLITAL